MEMRFIGHVIGRTKNTFKFIGHPDHKIKGTITQNTTSQSIIALYMIFTYIEIQRKAKSGESREGALIQKGPDRTCSLFAHWIAKLDRIPDM